MAEITVCLSWRHKREIYVLSLTKEHFSVSLFIDDSSFHFFHADFQIILKSIQKLVVFFSINLVDKGVFD